MSQPRNKLSVPVRIAALCVRAYQLTVSPAIHAIFGAGCGCRFQPTCSCYAREALFKHGFFSGCRLALGRILRCHPWNSGGYDPVPDLKTGNRQGIAPNFKTHLDG
ncbi:membrane protein insertion efficiency factor YidD [Coraliomargarita sinensis]|uniref:Putative membrane protein insertion efficiency factor n=1 Tax=Coraliomargarita sinensis TaxID=2174842 RepID=A0A317ZDJ7_9BACT|nr:membrane protein insertion efficiency factor YidD [Coraliomargarita sinensis]PXA03140.1 membrane protein insertion efficiency factor YidD [Coraliomargarita sinensis]